MGEQRSACGEPVPEVSALWTEALRLAEAYLGPEPEEFGSLASDTWYERLASAAERVARMAKWDLFLLEEATPADVPELPLNESPPASVGASEILLRAQWAAEDHENPPSFDDEAADVAFLAMLGVIELRIGSTTEAQLLRRIRRQLQSRDALARRAVELMPDIVLADRAAQFRRELLDYLVGAETLAHRSSQLIFDAVALLDEALRTPTG